MLCFFFWFCKRRETLFISLLSWLAVEVLSPAQVVMEYGALSFYLKWWGEWGCNFLGYFRKLWCCPHQVLNWPQTDSCMCLGQFGNPGMSNIMIFRNDPKSCTPILLMNWGSKTTHCIPTLLVPCQKIKVRISETKYLSLLECRSTYRDLASNLKIKNVSWDYLLEFELLNSQSLLNNTNWPYSIHHFDVLF